MEFETVLPTRLYQVFKGIAPFLDHVNFEYDTKGVSFQGMDAPHTSLISVAIHREECRTYKVSTKGTFGVSI
jgi:hypothetical protein